ncbi:hypothetical protein [Burkholderia stagnalis]|uniref:hypothetical protein n=1 Tax=Burkholderia stagnalis TaxID=1503054 RepID=UPI000758BE4C|nr:hypothetical protein [Burkholderia stagnalis]KVM89425.1 hypothetical protein WT05_04555 [Burkholderia stagnalis]
MTKNKAMPTKEEVKTEILIEYGLREVKWREQYLKSERGLNDMYARFRDPESKVGSFFRNVGIQIRIFQYETNNELGSIIRNQPEGFAKAVAVKGLIHKVVEFNKHLNEVIQPDMLKMAVERDMQFGEEDKRDLRRRWRATFKEIDKWKRLRDKTTGHYDPDLEEVVSLLETIDVEQVGQVYFEFVEYAKALLDRFREAGRRPPKSMVRFVAGRETK